MPTATPRGLRERSAGQTVCWLFQLHQRGVPLSTIDNALVLAAARRLLRPTQASPLARVRSLAYFLPVIEEVLELKVSQDYFQHARRRIQRLLSQPSNPPISR